ncbi:hypothetical protein ACMAZF_07010 [Psychrobium sp. nBUS_13]|uniref:hypothetical protein n=1 Tax=Psychrobium sp. nBUS_13 TaxID=3395319 RepID=UPI003EBA259B
MKVDLTESEVEHIVSDFSSYQKFNLLFELIDLNNIELKENSKEILFNSVVLAGDISAINEVIKRKYLPTKNLTKMIMHSCVYGENNFNVVLFNFFSTSQKLIKKKGLIDCANATLKSGNYSAFRSLFKNAKLNKYYSSTIPLLKGIVETELKKNSKLKDIVKTMARKSEK